MPTTTTAAELDELEAAFQKPKRGRPSKNPMDQEKPELDFFDYKGRHPLKIDFSKHPDLLEKLERMSAKCFRDPEQQVLALINEMEE